MNRNDFLKRLGLGAATVAMAPEILAEVPDRVPVDVGMDLANKEVAELPIIEKRFWPYMENVREGAMIASPKTEGEMGIFYMRNGEWIPVIFD